MCFFVVQNRSPPSESPSAITQDLPSCNDLGELVINVNGNMCFIDSPSVVVCRATQADQCRAFSPRYTTEAALATYYPSKKDEQFRRVI
jgi:hypothetical protein